MGNDEFRRPAIFAAAVLLIAVILLAVAPSPAQQERPEVAGERQQEREQEPEQIEYFVVYVDDEFLGYTLSPGDLQEVVDDFLRAQQVRSEFSVRPEEDLRLEAKTSTQAPRITPIHRLAREVQDRLTLVTHAVGIEVEGEVVVVLAREEEAESVLRSVRESHVEQLEADGKTDVLASEFVEDVRLVRLPAEPDHLVGPETAEEILIRGTDRTEIHEVEPGETAWGIAQAADLNVGELGKANPGRDLSRLHPGDEVELVVADPYVTLYTEEKSWYIRHVPHGVQTRHNDEMWPWERQVIQAGRPGEVRVTVRIEREDGREIAREIVEEEQISEPVTHIVMTGTKTVPQHGSGQFIMPAAGQLTSGFGWRRTGFHHGIDLAMPVGTPIKAADCGIVVAAGRSGAYGIKIKIDHGEEEYVTVYAHLSSTAVSTGDVVEQGQVIGYSGNTGRTTGPHLHFEIRVDGEPKNPLNFFQE